MTNVPAFVFVDMDEGYATGVATAMAEARVKLLCSGACCVLSQRLVPGVGLHE